MQLIRLFPDQWFFRGSHPMKPARIQLARVALSSTCCIAALWPSHAAAQSQAFRGALMDAVLLTLQHEPNIAAAHRRIMLSQGQLQSAHGEFDTALNAGLAVAQTRTSVATPFQSPGHTQVDARSASYALGATRRLRSGVVVAPTLDVIHVRDNFSNLTEPAGSTVALNFILPMLRGRGREVNTAGERAAEEALQAADFSYRHTVAARISKTTAVYWDYLAALRSRGIRLEAESRSEHLLADARLLAKGDEIPPADVLQYEAQLARESAFRIAAEQALAEARNILVLSMGLPGTDAATLAMPVDDFPELQGAAASRLSASWPVTAPVGRFDLLALQRRLASADILYDAALRDPASQLDVTVSLGYSEQRENRSALVAPDALRRPASGVNAALGLVYVLPVEGNVRGGLVQQRAALAEQARIELEALQQSVRTGIAIQRAAVASAALQLEQVRLQVRLQTQVFANERKKYRLGLGTALDVLTAEGLLTSAQLDEISARRLLAQALVNYRFETGTLLDAGGDAQSLTLQSLTTLPEMP
jgi:outer membrane protein TolC